MTIPTLRVALLALSCTVAAEARAQLNHAVFVPLAPQVAPEPLGPSARQGHAMAVDPNGKLILFGGDDGSLRNDTWCFDGETQMWSELSPPNSPSVRRRHSMATIPSGILLFGGTNGDGVFDDTWRWDGTTWTEVQIAGPRPPARAEAMLASEPGGAILFGGNGSAVGLVETGDTWRFVDSSGVWTNITPATSPPARAGAGMAAQAEAPHQIALFGGRQTGVGSIVDLNDTWFFDPATDTWSALPAPVPPITSPPARHDLVMAWDDLTFRWVMHGGDPAAVRDESWELLPGAGNDWVEQTLVPLPQQTPRPALTRSAAGFVADVGVLGAVVFFGGDTGAGLTSTTWLYGPRHAPITPVAAPVGNPLASNPLTDKRVLLGHVLFFDEQMSKSRTTACASCHMPEAGGTDPRPPLRNGKDPATLDDDVWASAGVIQHHASGLLEPVVPPNGDFGLGPQVTGRKSPSNLNASLFVEQFWDGRAREEFLDENEVAVPNMATGASLESQAVEPPISSVEMAHMDGADWDEVTTRLESVTPLALAWDIPSRLVDYIGTKTYAQLCDEAFPDSLSAPGPGVTRERVALALAAYQRTLLPTEATVLKLGYPSRGTAAARGGFIFETQAAGTPQCITCHTDEGNSKTDNDFHYIGVAPRDADLGRFTQLVEPGPMMRGAMKTPSLFNVELHNRFFHTGSKTTLRQVIDFYVAGGDFEVGSNDINAITMVPNFPRDGTFRPITEQDKDDLVAYLESFTDPRLLEDPLQPPFDRPKLHSERDPANPVLYGNSSNECPAGGPSKPTAIAIQPPQVDNDCFVIGVRGAPAGGLAVLRFGAQQAPPVVIGGINHHVTNQETVVVGVVSYHTLVGGYASVDVTDVLDVPGPYPVDLFCQWFILSDSPGACINSGSEGIKVSVYE